MKSICLLGLSALIVFSSCTKRIGGNGNPCNAIKEVRLSSNSPITVGEQLKLNASEVEDCYYAWSGPGFFQSYSSDNTISDVKLNQEGWYHLTISNPDCEPKHDSIYVDVKLKQGTPTCTIPNNQVLYSNLSDDTFTSVRRGIEGTLGLFMLEGSGPGSNIEILFHPYWRDHEPENGLYKTTNIPTISSGDYNQVYISTVKSSIYWSSYDFKDVYISHVGNKLQVKFCDLSMGGYNGTSYTTVASGTLTEN